MATPTVDEVHTRATIEEVVAGIADQRIIAEASGCVLNIVAQRSMELRLDLSCLGAWRLRQVSWKCRYHPGNLAARVAVAAGHAEGRGVSDVHH